LKKNECFSCGEIAVFEAVLKVPLEIAQRRKICDGGYVVVRPQTIWDIVHRKAERVKFAVILHPGEAVHLQS
jgi:hypothetical protein